MTMQENLSIAGVEVLETPTVDVAEQYGKTSGGRLKIARLLTGSLQQSIVKAKTFPQISVATLQTWESATIPVQELQKIANFFRVKPELFDPDAVSEETFWQMISQVRTSRGFS